MPPRDPHCPNCRSSRSRHLRESSDQAAVNYYLCQDCAHVWSIGRTGEHEVRNVTPVVEPTSSSPSGGSDAL
jgi:transposase-like protein